MKRNRPKWEIILSAMNRGQEVEVDGFVFTMFDNILHLRLMRATKSGPYKSSFAEPVWVVSDLPLNTFISMCEDVPDDDITTLCMNMALNEINRKDRST